MPDHLMDGEAALDLITTLTENGVDVCVSGGWAVDALLGEQTRPHGDLDLWLPAVQFEQAVVTFVRTGVDRLFPWGDDRPWNFVLHDGAQRRVDLHLYETLTDGTLHYGGIETGETFPPNALQGHGTIGTQPVRCETSTWSVRWHTGYTPRPSDHRDVERLCAKFNLELPAEFR